MKDKTCKERIGGHMQKRVEDVAHAASGHFEVYCFQCKEEFVVEEEPHVCPKAEDLQQLFQDEMEKDGYFEEAKNGRGS